MRYDQLHKDKTCKIVKTLSDRWHNPPMYLYIFAHAGPCIRNITIRSKTAQKINALSIIGFHVYIFLKESSK